MLRRTGADTRREILAAATQLFRDRGYRGTSIADLAHEIGYSKAAVLYHFDSKEALLAELIAPATADLHALLTRVDALPAVRRRRAAVQGYVDLTVTHRDAVAILQAKECRVLRDPHLAAIGPLYARLLELLAGESPSAQSRVAAIMVIVGSAAACTERGDLPAEELRRALVAVAVRALDLPTTTDPGLTGPHVPA